MQVLLGALIAVAGILSIAAMRWVVVLFHELGHAIPALLFTREPVEVLVGAYHERSGGGLLRLGRLRLRMYFNFTDPRIGLCRWSGPRLRTWKRAVVLIGGPIASTLIGGLLALALLQYQIGDLGLFVFGCFIALAFLDLATNLFPVTGQIDVNGQATFSDGLQLMALFARSSLNSVNNKLDSLIQNEKYQQAYTEARREIENFIPNAEVSKKEARQQNMTRFFMAIAAQETERYEEALTQFLWLHEQQKLERRLFLNVATCYYHLNQYEHANECLAHFRQAYAEDAAGQLLQTRSWIALSEYKLALRYATSALYYSSEAYEARRLYGLCLLRLEKRQEALQTLEALSTETPNDAENWFFLGQCYEALQRPEDAIAAYQKAKQSGGDYHGLDFRLDYLQ